MRRISQTLSGENLKTLQQTLEQQDAQSGWQVYPCKLVTPMYGGGVNAGKVDTEMPIRASAIRGQLRFWWRIACGPFASSQEMFKRETEIWGGIGDTGATASKVEVRVDSINPLTLSPAFKYVDDPKHPGKKRGMPKVEDWAQGYALFAAQGKISQDKTTIEKEPNQLAREGVGFSLHIRFAEKLSPEQCAEVETALRWWASFGGLGARTRRGLGAVFISSLTPVTVTEVSDKQGILKLKPAKDEKTAWKNAVNALREFRQGSELGRNIAAKDSRSPAGRSRWPEADTLRELSECAHHEHKDRIVSGKWFPRAAFGLPIVFHFQGAPKYRDPNKEPIDHILEPASGSDNMPRDRMASPLILRPYWSGVAWQSAALLLPDWQRALTVGLKFKGLSYKEKLQLWPLNESSRKHASYAIKPMNRRDELRALDPLSAFMQFFVEGN